MTPSSPSVVNVFNQTPHPALRPFVKRFLVVEFPSLCRDVHLPDTSPVAAFSFRGKCFIDEGRSVPRAAFTGLRDRLRAHEHGPGHAVLLAIFTPVGAAAFLRPPQDAFAGATTDLSDILGQEEEFHRFQEQLAGARNHDRRVKLLEGFLLARLRLSAPDPLVTAAVAWLERGTGARRIDHLTQYIGLSQSALERRFRRVVGISPKKFASLVRLQRAIKLRGSGADFAAVAQDAGYFDQSHLINDFRRVTGSSPDAFFRETRAE